MRPSDKSTRKPRVDAVRNRERVLEAAKAVFSAGGAEASLEAVARAAGVGIGTLYRHFPTREALFEAVYRREVQQLADLAEQLKQEPQPVDLDEAGRGAGMPALQPGAGQVACMKEEGRAGQGQGDEQKQQDRFHVRSR